MKKQITCKRCNGTGQDRAHKWPNGSFASCETCEGYGTVPAKPAPGIRFKVETLYASGWADAAWTISDESGDKPMRFDTVTEAVAEIADHCESTREAVREGNMESADPESDYRVVPVNASQYTRRGWVFCPVAPGPGGQFPEDLTLIQSLIGSALYESKLIDGAAFFIRRVS